MPASISVSTSVSVTTGRKCGHCHNVGHDRRNCPTAPKTAEPAKSKVDIENHLRFLFKKESGPCRLIDPVKFWNDLGPDAGTYPFERDHKGAVHMPKILVTFGSARDRAEIEKLPEYKFDAESKRYVRICGCPGYM
jgi:hypothetical protein